MKSMLDNVIVEGLAQLAKLVSYDVPHGSMEKYGLEIDADQPKIEEPSGKILQ